MEAAIQEENSMPANIHNPGPINLAVPTFSPKMRTKLHKNTQKYAR